MATLRGKGAMKGKELVIVEYPNAQTKDGKRVFLDVMLRDDASQVVPHLVSRKREYEGKTVYDHNAAYSAGQRDAFLATAGDNIVQMPDRNGKTGPRVYALKADVMSASGSQPGLVINSKTIEPSELEPVNEKTLDGIYAASKAAAEANKARKAAEKAAQSQVAAEAQVSEPEVEEATAVAENDEPEF